MAAQVNFRAFWWQTGSVCNSKRSCGCKRSCVWRSIQTWILWASVLGSVTGKTDTAGGVRSYQVNYLDCIKLWCRTLVFHEIRLNKQSLKHSIKQCMLSVLGKINLFRLGRGEGSPPPLPLLATRLSMPLNVIKKYLHLINL